MKRFWPLIALFCLLTALVGCTGDDSMTKVIRVWNDEEDVQEENAYEEEVDTSELPKAGIVVDISGKDDGSVNQSAWEGLKKLEDDKTINATCIEPESADMFYKSFTELADDGCDICWGVGYMLAEDMLKAAGERPETHFAIVDNAYEQTPENVTGVVFREQESSFMVGYIAASASKTGKIGFIGGTDSKVIDRFKYGFMAGAKYAADLYAKNVNIRIEYTGSFTDTDKGYDIAVKMYDEDCDIIYGAAGESGLGLINAAKEKGKFVIGVDKDQSELAPDNVLTSAMKDVGGAVGKVTAMFLRGEDISGKTISLGLTEGAVRIPTEHSNYKDEIYDSVLSVEDKIKSTRIVPPTNLDEYNEFVTHMDEY